MENDIVYTAPLVQGLAARVTLTSPPGQTNTLMRAALAADTLPAATTFGANAPASVHGLLMVSTYGRMLRA